MRSLMLAGVLAGLLPAAAAAEGKFAQWSAQTEADPLFAEHWNPVQITAEPADNPASPASHSAPPAYEPAPPAYESAPTVFDSALSETGWTTEAPPLSQSVSSKRIGGGFAVDPVSQSPDAPSYFDHTPAEAGIPENLGDYAPELAPGQEWLYEQPPQCDPAMPPPVTNEWRLTFPQRHSLTWLPGSGDDVGWFDFDLRGTAQLGSPNLTIQPGFGLHFIDGPSRTDLPARLYDVYAEFRYMKQLSRQLGVEIALTPGWFSDGDNTSSDAFRLPARAVGFYAVSYETRFVLGVAYLDRENMSALPVLGMIYARDDLRVELIFPRPKVALLIDSQADAQRWAYIAGEFGGGSWAIERRNGRDDVATYTDWRLNFGCETKHTDKSSRFAEVGFVFNRELEYESNLGDFDPDATAMFRIGSSY